MKIYISASIPRLNEAYDLGATLKKAGHVIVSYWHDNNDAESATANYHSTERAVRDLEGVEQCELFIELVGDSNKSRGGRHCELGIAIALNKQIILIGPDDDCIFTWLPEAYMTKYESIDNFIAERVTILDPKRNAMTAFEKWCDSNGVLPCAAKEDKKDGYIQALQWLKEAINSCMTVDDVQDVLEKELGE